LHSSRFHDTRIHNMKTVPAADPERCKY
jgi:hypothetical protein